MEQKQRAFLIIREIIMQHASSYEDALGICQNLGINYNPRNYDSLTLSWENIALLYKHPLATIGNHTHSHAIFNNLSEAQVEADIIKAQNLFKAHNLAPTHFAYPFGGRVEVASKYFHIPKQLGFKTATTTRAGTIYNAHKAHLCALPRFMLSENFHFDSLSRVRRARVVTN